MPETRSGTPGNPFADLNLDRAAEHRDDTAWLAAREAAADTRYLCLDADLRLAVDAASGQPRWFDGEQRRRWFADVPASLLGVADGRACFLLHDTQDAVARIAPHTQAIRWLGLREAGMQLDAFHAGLFAYARGLAHWQSITRFCHACGSELARASAGHRAVCTRSDCGLQQFPRTDTAVIVIVEHDGACLLGRQASWPEGRYSTLAGFVEPGETLEGAVRREVNEEAGIAVADCHYHSSQPWPFPASLMVGFTAMAKHRDIILRDGELEDARWFTPGEVVAGVESGSLLPSSRVSVAWRLLADWMQASAGVDLAQVRRK